MHATIQTLKNAFAYAKFSDDDIANATRRLIDELGIDLQGDDAEYEPGSSVDSAVQQLEEALNTADAAREEMSAAIIDAQGTAIEEDDEDGG